MRTLILRSALLLAAVMVLGAAPAQADQKKLSTMLRVSPIFFVIFGNA
jgi:hypothetical protein